MVEFLSANEGAVRLSVFLGVFAVMALWEFSAPRRELVAPKPNRWGVNWGIVIIDTLVVRILFPAAAVGAGGGGPRAVRRGRRRRGRRVATPRCV